MKNVKMRLMAIILCISFVVSGIGPMPTSLAAEAPFQSGSAQKNNQSNLFNEEFVKTNLAQADSVQSDSVQPDSVQPNSEQKNAGDEIQTGTEGKVSEPSNLINITTDISSGLSAEEDDASSTPAPAGPPLTDSEEDLKNSASVQQATVQLQAETITTGITLEAMTKYTGVKTRVTRGELPAALQGFSKIMVACSAVPYNVAESGLPQWISSAYKGTYDDNYYISSVSQTGDLYALVVLFDDEENPLGYYETSINVPLGQQVPEITSGVSVSSPEPLSYMVDIVREELPEALRSYSTYSTMLSYASFNVPENGLSPWLDNAARNDYSDGANSFGAGEARSWTVLVVLYDSQDNPLGYYESNVEITVGIQLPTITSGIRFENLSDYLGFSTVIERDNLPEFARGFSKISVQRMNSPFEIQQYGIQRWVSGGYKQTYTEPVSTTVESPSLWYALVILFDANENPIGYLETTVNVIPGIQVPAVTTGIGFENMAAYNGFYTSVTNNSLPEFIRDFSKITVNISGSPFNVTQAGIPGYILNGYKQPYSNPIFTGVDRPGTYSVLVVLYDANENPIGYTEANLTVTGATGLPQISAGISLENSSIYRGIEATVSRDQLPEFARQFSKITGTVSYAPFNVAQNGLPGWMENSYKKIYENNPYLVSVYGYQNYYVLIVLFDNQDNPIGYYETSFNAENQITLPVLEAGISLESSTDNTGLNIRVNRSLLPENAAGFSRIRAIESSDSYNVSQNGLPSWIEDGYTDEYHEPYYPFNTYGLGERNILVILFNNSNIPVGYFETKVNILEALPTPQNILLSSSDSSVHITWDNVEGATGYELLIGENTSVTVPTAEYTHSGLSPVTQYGYRIRAIDENNPGRFSDWSAVLYKYTILPVPSNITATAYEDSISLSWAAVEGALQYELVIDGGTVKIVHGNSYLHSGLEPNSEHSYKLRAIYTYNIELSGNWSEVVSKKTRLRTPSDIWAKTAIRSIELKWNPIEGATGYELTADGQKVTVTGTSYIHSGLEPDSLHTYRLKAIDDNGNQSEESAELKVKTKNATSEISSGISFESNPGYTGINTIVDKSQLPAFAQDFSKICLLVEKEPFNIDVNGLPEAIQYTKKEVYKAPYYFSGFDKPGNYDVLIVLFDINENPVGYMESEVNLTAGGLETPLLTTGVTFENSAANRGFNTIIDRNVLPEAVRNFSKIYVHSMKEPFKENVEQNGIPGFIRNMDKFTYAAPYFTTNVYEIGQYNVLLILVDAANNPIGYFEAQINVTGPAKLPVPQNIRASSTDRAVVLTWDAVAGADGYEVIADNIYYYVTGTEYVHMNLPANSFHNYQVRASVPMTPEKSSEWSQVISKLTLLQVPEGFYTTVTSNSVELYWNTVSGASYYEVLADGTLTTVYGTSYVHNNLQPDSMHVYQVKAKNFEGNESVFSYEIVTYTKKSIQPVTTGIKLENSANQNYFNTVITRSSLPEWARDFSKIRVITSKSPFNVAENGINPSYTSWSDWYYDPYYATYVNTLGNWYALVILFDYANNPIGYLESSINVALPQDDHGNDFNTATPVKAGQSIPGVITAGDVDFFAFTPTISGSYTMYTESSMDTYGYLYDSNQQLITYNDDSIGYNFSITAILQANKTYYIKVRHYDQSSGTGTYVFKVSNVAGGVQPLSVPTNLSYTASGTEINLKWDSVAGATEYEVLVDNLATEVVYEAKFVHSGLVSGSTHSYKVRAIDSANPDRTSQWSELLPAYIKLETPGNIIASPGLKQIGLTWNEVGGATGYEVLIDGITTEAVNEATFTHGNLSSGSTHSYKIRAISSENLNITSQWSDLLWVNTLLETPSNIVAKPGLDSITVTWDSVAGASNYELEADNKIFEVSKNNYSHMGLEPQTTHTYRVRAKNGNIYSEWSSVVNATTSLAIPMNITGVPTVSQITLSWDNIQLATGYEILVDGEQNEFVTTPSFIHVGLAANTTHTYKVRAIYENNQAIVSDWSQPLEVSTLLNAPENINTKVLSNSVELTWDSVDGATSYEVEADGSIVEVTSATYIHRDINPNSTHVYRVRAKKGSLLGEWSNKVTVTTTLSVPGNVTASSSVSTITVKWNAVAEATAYDLMADDVLVENITATSYVHMDLQGGTVHKYKVRARNGDVSGPWSNEVSATTLLSTVVSGSIKKDILWTAAESPYELQGNVTIEAGVILTIEPGVIVKTSSSSSRLTVQGKVSAAGLPDKPIIFTAPKDSLLGGNGSGFDWYGITVGSSGEFTGDYVKIRYAGGGRNYGNTGNAISTEGKLVLTNSEVSHTYGTGINIDTQGTKDITVENSDISYNSLYGIYISKYGTGAVSIKSNSMTNNGSLPIAVNLSGLGSSIFAGLRSNQFSDNKYNNSSFDGIGISGSVATNMSLSTNKYILTGSVTVPKGMTLTAEAGTVTLSGSSGYSLRVDGTLNAAGTESNPVVFTAPKDAEYGNGNGATYDWYGITVADTGEFTGDYVKIRYAGGGRSYGDKGNAIDTDGKLTLTNSEVSNTYGTGINIYIQGTQDVTVENCIIRDSLRNGIYISKYGTGSMSIKNNSLSNNANLPIAVYLDGLGSSIFGGISGNEFSGNKYNNLNFDGIGISGALKSDVTLSKNLYIITGYIGVTSGKILTMQPGVRILDSGSHNINVDGILRAIGTETDPIIFTAPKDAEYGNGNGATYDWYGITVADTGEFTGDYVKIRYAGGGRSYGDKGNAIDTDGKLTLTNSEVSNTYGTGINIYIQGTQDVTVENCIIRDSLRNGIYISKYGTGSMSIKNNSLSNNANLPIAVYLDGLGSSIFGGISGNEFSGNKYNNLNFDGIGISGALKSDVTLSKNLYIITGYIGVTSGKILTMQPGVRILDSGSHNINVDGILRAIGTETDPIIFTAPKDEVYGNGNGATYDWYGITVTETGEFTGDHIKIRYAGGGRSYGDKGNAIDTDGKLTLTNSEISNTYGTGINMDTQGTQDVTVENCIIRDSLRSGIYINGFGTGELSIRDNCISNNANLPIALNLNRIGSSIFGGISNNEFTGNSYGSSSFDGIGLSGKLLVDVTLTENQYIIVGSISVPAGKIMTIEPGVRMLAIGEWNSSNQIHVEGILRAIGTEAKPVIFTAPKDEVYGNGNGQAYNWYGITVTETGEFTGDHIKIRYAGGGRSYQGRGRSIETSGKLVLTNSEVSHSYETGIYVDTTGLQNLVVESCSINDNPLYGIYINGFGAGILSIKDNLMSNNANLPIVMNLNRLGSSIFGGISNNEFTGNSYGGSSFDGIGLSGELPLDMTLTKNQYINVGSLVVPYGKTLTIQPGVRILAGGPQRSNGIHVEGVLNAIGTEADPIIFTAPKDEVYGNGNGQTFDWYGINIKSTGVFTGDNIKIRYAGGYRIYGYKAMSIEVNGKLVLTNSEVSYSGGTGIYLDTDIQPVLKTVTIEHNEFGMENANNQSMTVDAQYNYWGAVDGPSIRMYDEKLNRWYWVGTGDKVGDGINYYPYLGQELKYKFHFGGNGTNAPTGNYSRTFTDISISSPGFSLDFNRSYNSGDDRQNGPFGQGWTFGFESNIKDYDGIIPIKLVRLPDGSVQTFDVNSNGTFTARDNRNCLERKENGTFLLTTKDQNQFSFNSNGYLEYMKDKYGNTVSLEVDSDGKVRGLTDQTGRHFTVTYENGHITAIKDDVGGRTVRYEYENGLLTKAYDPMNNVTGYSYDAQGYLEEIRNSSNKVTESIEYINSEGENLHKVDKTTDVNGKTQTYTYDNVNRKTIITDNNGRQSVKWYDSSMFVTNQRDYEEKIETTEYDTGSDGVNKYGEEKALTDRNGNTTQFDRDERGNIKKITYPDLTTEEFEYDDRNNVIKEKDQQGRYTFYIFDTAKVFLLKKVQPLDGTSSYVEGTSDVSKFAITRYVYYTDSERQQLGYKAKGLVKTIEDPMGSITSYTYYSDGSIKELIEPTDSENPGTRKTVYSYNQDRLKNEEVSSKGYRTEYIYDKNGNLEKTIKYGEDGTTAESVARTTYDEEGRKKQDISPKLYNSDQDYMQNHAYSGNDGYRYTYYDNGKLHTVTDPENNTTTYTYDIYGNMASETKPNLSEYYYEYDVMNRLTKISFKENAQAEAIVLEEYSYTILGDKRTQKTEKRYIKDTETTSTIYTYDYAGRPVEQKNADGTLVYTEYYGDGKVKRTTDEDGYSTYYNYGKYDSSTNTSYDELYVPAEYVVRSVKYAYTRIDYDKSGRKIKEIKGVDTTALNEIPSKLVITDYTYYKNGRLKEQSDSNGRKTVYTYDADGNVKSEEVFTEEQNSIITAYKNNYLGKPEEKSITVRKGDIAGNDAEDNDTIELTTYLEYDKNGMLSTVRTPDGITTAYQYDKLDRTISVSKPGTDENGNSVNISQSTEYDTEGNVVSVTDGNGNTTQNTYDKRGLLLSVKNAEGGITAYYYDRAGRKVAEVAPKAFSADKSLEEMDRITYTYDVIDRVKTVTYTGEEKKYNPATHTWTSSQVEIVQKAYKYDNQGNVIKELDALGYQAGTGFSAEDKIDTGYGTEYTYNPAGKVTTIVDAESKQNYWRYKSQYTYDALGRVLTETNANRTVTGYSYDDAGNITKETVEWYFNGSEKIIKTSTYDLLGNEKTQTDGNGNTTRYLYNSFGKLHKTINPGDSTIPEYSVIHQYDVMGNLAVKKDSSGTVDTYSYDSYGRLLEHTQSKADGTESITTASRYDKNGNKRFETDGNGVTTEFTYDGLNRVKSQGIMVSGTEQLTAYDYDANGNQTAVTDWKGNSYTSSYDSLGRIIDKKDPYGISIEKYEYNNNNVQVKAYDALDNVTQYSYDRNNRLLSTTDPENHVTSQEYDSVGNISSKTDGSNNTTSYEYDEQNRLVKVTDASNGVTSYTYDLSGNMLTQTDGKGNQVIWEYNAANMVTRRIDDGGRTGAEGSCSYDSSKVESYTYNADGSLAAKTDRNGIVTSYTYDVHGRLTSNSVGGITIQYTYDKNGNQLTITDQTGKTTRTYDQLNRVITKEVPNIGKSIYTYDITAGIPEGNWAESTSDPKGNITVKTYDRAGRLKTVTADGKTTTYNYYDNGARQSVEYSDGSREAYTYYKDNLLHTLTNTKADGTVIDNYSYTYDAAHNETSKVDAKGTTAYTYDALNRLKTVTEPNGRTTTYTYDRAGNREREAIAEGSSTTVNYYRYNEQNRLLEVAAAVNGVNTGTTHYSYDNNGNMTSVTVNGTVTAVNTYDELNQLIKTVTGGKTVENRYNGEGLRVEKLVDGVITRYLYEYDKVVLELDGTGGQTGRNVYGTNLLMRTAGNETYIYMYNGHADVTALLRPDGTVAATYYYDAFGNITDTTGSASNSVTYAGYQYDSETGLYYLNARMYDPKTARFLQEDTYRGEANDPLSLNLYTYVNNNPVKYDDPTGHFANLLLGGLIGAVAGAVIDIGSQMIFEHKSFDEIDWKSVAVSTVDGGISGVLGAATGGISYIATAGKQTGKHIIKKAVNTMLVEAATASYANAMAQYAVKGEVDWGQVASTALISGVSGGLSSGLSSSKALNSFVDSAKEKTSKILSDISDSFPSRQLAGTNGLSFNASSINGLEDVTKTAVKKNAIQENYINVTKKLDNAVSFVDDISPADALKNKMGNAGVIEANYTLFNKTHKGSLPVPKGTGPNGGRLQSHHGLQKEWSMENLKQYGYDPDLAPTITIETGKGFPHTSISNAQNLRRNARVASGNGKWSSTLQDELQYIVDDFTNAGYSRGTIEQVMEQQYKMLDKLGVNYERIGIK